MKNIFTVGEVAKIYKVAPRTVSKWFDSGRLRGYRIPGSQDRRIQKEYLIRFMKEHGMPLSELDEEKHFKFTVYKPGNGAECLDYTIIYTSSGKDLEEAKSKLVKEKGCSPKYFDDVDYVKIEEIPSN